MQCHLLTESSTPNKTITTNTYVVTESTSPNSHDCMCVLSAASTCEDLDDAYLGGGKGLWTVGNWTLCNPNHRCARMFSYSVRNYIRMKHIWKNKYKLHRVSHSAKSHTQWTDMQTPTHNLCNNIFGLTNRYKRLPSTTWHHTCYVSTSNRMFALHWLCIIVDSCCIYIYRERERERKRISFLLHVKRFTRQAEDPEPQPRISIYENESKCESHTSCIYHIYACIYIYICTNAYVYIYIYICIYMYIYIYTYTHNFVIWF